MKRADLRQGDLYLLRRSSMGWGGAIVIDPTPGYYKDTWSDSKEQRGVKFGPIYTGRDGGPHKSQAVLVSYCRTGQARWEPLAVLPRQLRPMIGEYRERFMNGIPKGLEQIRKDDEYRKLSDEADQIQDELRKEFNLPTLASDVSYPYGNKERSSLDWCLSHEDLMKLVGLARNAR